MTATEQRTAHPTGHETPKLPAFIAGRDEVLAGEQHDRVLGPCPPGHVLVVCIARHRYVDKARDVNALMLPGQQYYMDETRVAGCVARKLVHVPRATQLEWWNAAGRILAAEPADDVHPLADGPSEGALRIVAGVGYDPGAAAFRLHSAVNETTKHASAFVRWSDSNPHCSLRQYDGVADAAIVRDAMLQADVIHCHVQPFLINNTGIRPRPDQLVIRHYHGSAQTGSHLEPIFDRAQGYLLLGARLSLVAEAKAEGLAMDWSPIPVPVQRYRALRAAARKANDWRPLEGAATPARPLRIAHSPTNERIKGSTVLREVVHRLRELGVPVEVDWIRGVTLAESLRRKALCDVAFDSFWLGIQGSGLEAGAMELPVIAGDPDVADLYRGEIGHVPYIFANDAGALGKEIERLAMDAEYRAAEAETVATYVEHVHDYEAVARRYELTLSRALGRSDVLTWGA